MLTSRTIQIIDHDHRLDAAEYIDTVLKGTRTTHMPVEEVSRSNFVVGAKVADELGIAVPTTIQALATEIIE